MKRDLFFYHQLVRVMTICGAALAGLIICIILSAFLVSCKTEYVPVPEYHTVIVNNSDTVKIKDTLRTEKETILREARPEDSAMIAKLGIKLKENERLLIFIQSEFNEKIRELMESHNRDSVRVDSVRVPVPVERKLSKFEQVCLDYGKLMMGGTIVAVILVVIIIIWWIRKKVI